MAGIQPLQPKSLIKLSQSSISAPRAVVHALTPALAGGFVAQIPRNGAPVTATQHGIFRSVQPSISRRIQQTFSPIALGLTTTLTACDKETVIAASVTSALIGGAAWIFRGKLAKLGHSAFTPLHRSRAEAALAAQG